MTAMLVVACVVMVRVAAMTCGESRSRDENG
jgi:hypothetical protein